MPSGLLASNSRSPWKPTTEPTTAPTAAPNVRIPADFEANATIDASGLIVGYALTAGGVYHAFLSNNGGPLQDLGTLGGAFSYAAAINEKDQVVGSSDTAAGTSHAFLWQRGTMTDLGTLGGDFSYAIAVNARGQVIGVSSLAPNSYNVHGFLWYKGVMKRTGTKPKAGARSKRLHRAVLKISGEGFGKPGGFGLDGENRGRRFSLSVAHDRRGDGGVAGGRCRITGGQCGVALGSGRGSAEGHLHNAGAEALSLLTIPTHPGGPGCAHPWEKRRRHGTSRSGDGTPGA